MSLSYDIARCSGTTYPICQSCRRREPGREYWQTMIAPAVGLGICRNLIEPEPIYQTGSVSQPPSRDEE